MLIKGVPEQVDFERVSALFVEIGVDPYAVQEVRFTRDAMHVTGPSVDGPHVLVVPITGRHP